MKGEILASYHFSFFLLIFLPRKEPESAKLAALAPCRLAYLAWKEPESSRPATLAPCRLAFLAWKEPTSIKPAALAPFPLIFLLRKEPDLTKLHFMLLSNFFGEEFGQKERDDNAQRFLDTPHRHRAWRNGTIPADGMWIHPRSMLRPKHAWLPVLFTGGFH